MPVNAAAPRISRRRPAAQPPRPPPAPPPRPPPALGSDSDSLADADQETISQSDSETPDQPQPPLGEGRRHQQAPRRVGIPPTAATGAAATTATATTTTAAAAAAAATGITPEGEGEDEEIGGAEDEEDDRQGNGRSEDGEDEDEEGDEGDEGDEEDDDDEDDDDDASFSTDANKLSASPRGLKEIGNLASWTVSTAKPGNGIEQLRDDDTALFWQSDGPQPHYINIHFAKRVKVKRILMNLDFENDESYTPTRMSVLSGTGHHDLVEVTKLDLERPSGWVEVKLDDVHEDGELRTFLIQVAIHANHQNGKDTHVRGLKIYAVEPCAPSPRAVRRCSGRANVLRLLQDGGRRWRNPLQQQHYVFGAGVALGPAE